VVTLTLDRSILECRSVKLLGVTLDSGSDDGPARCCHDDRSQ